MITTLEYKLEEKDPERLNEIVGFIKGLKTLFDFLGLLKIPEKIGSNLVKGSAKYGGVFNPSVELIHLLAQPKKKRAAFLFDAYNQSCADGFTDRVIGYYDSNQEKSQFERFRYGWRAGGTYMDPRPIDPIKELESLRLGSHKTIKITYKTGYFKETKGTVIFKR